MNETPASIVALVNRALSGHDVEECLCAAVLLSAVDDVAMQRALPSVLALLFDDVDDETNAVDLDRRVHAARAFADAFACGGMSAELAGRLRLSLVGVPARRSGVAVRRIALAALAAPGHERACGELQAVLLDETLPCDERMSAAEALGFAATQGALAALVLAARDDDRAVASAALRAMRSLRHEAPAVVALRGALVDDRPDVRAEACMGLFACGGADALAAARVALDTLGAALRVAATRALAASSLVEDRVRISRLVDDEVEGVRRVAAYALRKHPQSAPPAFSA